MSQMCIDKIVINNFKCFDGEFEMKFNEGMNIIVGDNDAGKSTIVEAINLALTGFFHGRYLKDSLTQYLFNNAAVDRYLKALANGDINTPLPAISIDLYFKGDGLAKFEGDGNSRREKGCGVSYLIEFDDQYKPEYETLLKGEKLTTLPIEYYTVNWSTFARDKITSRGIPIKSALIEAMASKMLNGSDVYISRIIREILDDGDKVGVSQAHRKIRDLFQADSSITAVNAKLQTAMNVSDRRVTLAIDLATKNAWETVLMTYIDEVPFHYVGRGEQSIIKTRLALSHKKALEASVLLIEEPENHLTHANLNKLINRIDEDSRDKQIIITTHSSYVANKLSLDNLLLLNRGNEGHTYTKIGELPESGVFFKKLPGYDTLRLVLAKKAVLVEGDADELVVQKAYALQNNGRLPIQDGVEVISVGTSFLRFLEIAKLLNKKTSAATDNDGDVDSLDEKYAAYTPKTAPHIGVFYDREIDSGNLTIGKKKKPFNYNTLEPKMVKANGLKTMNAILGTSYSDMDKLHIHMRANKTEVALKIFETDQPFTSPQYILDAISWIGEDKSAGGQ